MWVWCLAVVGARTFAFPGLRMNRHRVNGLSFDVPDEWDDRTIVAFTPKATARTKPAPSFVLTQDPMRIEDSLRSHVDRQLLELHGRMPGFALLHTKETTCGGSPAIALRYTWTSDAGALEQTVTTVERIVRDKRVAMSATTTMSVDEGKETRELLDYLVRSVRFDGEVQSEAQAPSSYPPPPISQIPQSAYRYADGFSDPQEVPMPGFRSNGRR